MEVKRKADEMALVSVAAKKARTEAGALIEAIPGVTRTSNLTVRTIVAWPMLRLLPGDP